MGEASGRMQFYVYMELLIHKETFPINTQFSINSLFPINSDFQGTEGKPICWDQRVTSLFYMLKEDVEYPSPTHLGLTFLS